jgi:hypothetical protein
MAATSRRILKKVYVNPVAIYVAIVISIAVNGSIRGRYTMLHPRD